MLRFYWRLIKRTPVLLWRALTGLDAVVGVLALLFGAIGIGAWWRLLPLWTPFAAFGVILLYGFLRANYEEYIAVEEERSTLKEKLETAQKRKALNDLLGDALEEGRKLGGGRRYILGEDERPTAQERYQGEVHGWVEHTRELIEAAFGKAEAERFLSSEGYKQEGIRTLDNLRTSQNKYVIPVRLWRLDQLIVRANELPINPDFDPQEWTNRK